MGTTPSPKAVEGLRWIAFLPGATLGAWVAWLAFNFLNRATLLFAGANPNSFITKLYLETSGGMVLGAAFVYAGAKIAPSHRQMAAYGLAGLGLVLAGFALYPAILVENWWAVVGDGCVVVGLGAVAYSVHRGETKLD